MLEFLFSHLSMENWFCFSQAHIRLSLFFECLGPLLNCEMFAIYGYAVIIDYILSPFILSNTIKAGPLTQDLFLPHAIIYFLNL